MKHIYIGAFPPPYGGVTIKNKLVFEEISKFIQIEKSQLYNKHRSVLIRVVEFIIALFKNNIGFIIGISNNSLIKMTKILYIINKKSMNRSIVMVMGGTIHNIIINDAKLIKIFKEYKHVFVETNGMKSSLNSVGINNVSVFPNCRKVSGYEQHIFKVEPILKCVFFSLISEDKGVDIIEDSISLLEERNIQYKIDFYGHIDDKYKNKFEKLCNLNEKVNYKGIYKSQNDRDLYEKLAEYDLLLLPTKWKNEGVPGILIESKIAGLPAIVSNINFNSEIIQNEINGIVLNNTSGKDLCEAICKLYDNKDLLYEMKINAKKSSQNYYIENYIDDVVKIIEQV